MCLLYDGLMRKKSQKLFPIFCKNIDWFKILHDFVKGFSDGLGDAQKRERYVLLKHVRSHSFIVARLFLLSSANSHLWCSNSAHDSKASATKNCSTLYRFWSTYLSLFWAVLWNLLVGKLHLSLIIFNTYYSKHCI